MTQRLKTLASLVTDCTPDGARPFVALDSVESGTGRLLAPEDLPVGHAPESGAASSEPGDVLFGKLRPYLAKTWLVDRPVFASTELLCLRPVAHIASRWFAYLCASDPVIQWSVATSDGTKMPRTSWEKLRDFRLSSVPSFDIQSGIADFLDRETGDIDALIAANRRMAELVTERWQVLRIALVTATTDAARATQNGPPWLGRIPHEWSIERLKFLARMESGHTPDRKIDAYWIDCTIPWVTLNDVGALQRDWKITESVNAINELGMANSAAHLLPTGTVILSRDATVGRAAILGVAMAVSQHFVGWICGPRLRPEYLLHVLRGPTQRHFASLTAGATIATIGMPELSQLVVPVPPLDEQDRIIGELRTAEDRFQRMSDSLEQQVQLLRERRHSLVTAAVAGVLEVTNAA